MEEHLGYPRHDPAGREAGSNSRNGTRTKTVTTEVGPVEVDVPRDRDGTFKPKTVRKRQRRLVGVDAKCAITPGVVSDLGSRGCSAADRHDEAAGVGVVAPGADAPNRLISRGESRPVADRSIVARWNVRCL